MLKLMTCFTKPRIQRKKLRKQWWMLLVLRMSSVLSKTTPPLSQAKRSLETQLGELENKFAEANENAMRCGRAAMAKLETRIRELEVELGNVQAHTGENAKGYQKSER